MDVFLPWARRTDFFDHIGMQIGNNALKYRANIQDLVKARVQQEQVSQKTGEDTTRKDFYHFLLHATDPETGTKYTLPELTSEATLLVGAGTDTSAATISTLFFHLIRSERVLSKLNQEIRNTFSDVEEITTGPKISSIQYLKACVEEALRISSPVPGVLEREVLVGGYDVDKHHIPEGMTVAVAPYAIHRNEKYYSRPFDFIPERWIAGSPVKELDFAATEESVEKAKSTFFAFSLGTRGCIGKNMAYMELYLAFARILFLYDIRNKSGDRTGEVEATSTIDGERPGDYKFLDWFITERQGPVVEFRARQATTA